MDGYNTHVQDVRYVTLAELVSSLFFAVSYIRFVITIRHNSKHEANIQAFTGWCGSLSSKNQFFEVTNEKRGVSAVAANAVDDNMNQWTALFGVGFREKSKYHVMLWEDSWMTQYYKSSGRGIIFWTVWYCICFGLSCHQIISWWLVIQTY